MGRRKSYTEAELLDVTKKLLLEHGYDGFHLKLLSEHLVGARSTIYQYFANKEEIVAACMKRVMRSIMSKSAEVDETDSLAALQQILYVYVEESDFHQLLGDAHKIKIDNSEAAARDMSFIEQGHEELKVQLSRIFAKASHEGHLRQDVPLPAQISVFFNLINTPNVLRMPLPEWSVLLFSMWMKGVAK